MICTAGFGVVALIVASMWLDEGEVVTLTTVDARGNRYEAGLWIVDLDGVSYLRATSPDASWLNRIRQFSDVTLDRGGRRTDYHAIPIDDPKVRKSVSRAMAAKYGNFDRALVWLRDHRRSVPIRLQSSSARYAAPRSDPSIGVSP